MNTLSSVIPGRAKLLVPRITLLVASIAQVLPGGLGLGITLDHALHSR